MKSNDLIVDVINGEPVDFPYLQSSGYNSLKNCFKEMCCDLLNLLIPIVIVFGLVGLVIYLFTLI